MIRVLFEDEHFVNLLPLVYFRPVWELRCGITTLAEKLKELEIPVTIVDGNWNHLKPARQAGVPAYYGEVLSEVAEHDLAFDRFGYLVAATDNQVGDDQLGRGRADGKFDIGFRRHVTNRNAVTLVGWRTVRSSTPW